MGRNKKHPPIRWVSIILGKDGQPSIRRVLAMAFSVLFCRIAEKGGDDRVLFIIAGLITALLAIVTTQNIFEHEKDKHPEE